jgi:hypothetical protein
MRSKLKALMAATAIGAIPIGVQPAQAQVYYTINGQPAAPAIALMMAQRRLVPRANWYDARTGNWGRMGSAYPIGNIPNGRAWSSYSGSVLAGFLRLLRLSSAAKKFPLLQRKKIPEKPMANLCCRIF